MSRLLIALFALAAAVAAGDQMAGPTSGVLIDSQTRAIRPIIGVPGSAYAGESAVSEADFALASADGRTALIARDSMLYVLRRLDSGQPVWRSLGDEAVSFGRAAWSQDAKALALQLPEQSRIQLWSGMQDTPEIAGEVDLSTIDGRLTALAVVSDGKTAFAAFESGEEGVLYILKAGEAPRMLLPMSRPGALVLHDKSLFLADRERNEVIRIENWDFSLSMATIANAAQGVANPVGIALAHRGETLLVANGDTRQVVAVNAKTSAVEAAVDLDFIPTRLEPTGSVFLLASGTAGERPAQVLDADSMKVFFVPIPAPAPVAALD